MSRITRNAAIAGALLAVITLITAPASARVAQRRPVDLVICLDTSGSMTALIDSARAKLWDIVNELADAKPVPQLRVGLLTYGSPNNSDAAGGWIVRQIDLTDDLDSVYAKMMAMETNGGDEFVGWVLNDAVKRMEWSRDPNALKIIWVAGNESADQARERHDFRYVAESARGKDIFINSIYAGGRAQGVKEHWHEVAIHGGGNFNSIDMAHGTIQISTPQDDILTKLNVELNATYVPYGTQGYRGQQNQVAQDSNAARMGEQSCSSRAVAKASPLYTNAIWDLVDAFRDDASKLAELKEAELPENMRKMTDDERVAYIKGMQQSRAAIQKRIQDVSAERQRFLDEARKQQGQKTGLDDAMLESLRKQAGTKGFKFKVEVSAETTES